MIERRLPLIAVIRLGLFQGCVGALAYVFSGLLNRVMLTELAFPGVLVGGVLAIAEVMAVARILFGQISDRYAIGGRHRIPYIWLGTAIFCGLTLLVVPLIFQLHSARLSGEPLMAASLTALLCGIFALYGLGISLATTPFLALVIDRTSEEERPQAIGIIWCLLSIGIVVGAISGDLSLRELSGETNTLVLQPVLMHYVQRLVAIVVLLTLVGTWGLEPRNLERSSGNDREDSVTLGHSWRLITSSRQTLVFAIFLLAFTLSLFLQDPVLESYGAEVFGMDISGTARLTALWGIGVLVGLLVGGFLIVPRIGKLATSRLGCRLIILSMLLLMTAGLFGSPAFLQMVMWVFGLASGIGTNGTLSLMLDFTLPEAAGTFVGVWGLTQAYSRALGKIFGGFLLDAGRQLHAFFGFGDGVLAPYLLVLGVETLVAFTALVLINRLNMGQFKDDTGQSLSQVQAMELG